LSLRVALQMDPIESINIDGDSSFVLGLEAQRRGYDLYHYHPKQLMLNNGRALARGRSLTLKRERGAHFILGPWEDLHLAEFDVILMRQDPPFDMAYITATHILEHVHPKTLVVNDPIEVRNAPEKLYVTHFPSLMPPTLITSDLSAIRQFREEHRDIILKPLFGNGGAGVFHVTPEDENLQALLEVFTQLYREPVIVQRYLPAVRAGDKRIILIDGKPVGAINRIPPKGEARSNMHAGGVAQPSSLSERDLEICAMLGPELKRKGLIFTGIDVIGDYLTEINVTSPTGIQEINRFDGKELERDLWDAIEARLGQIKPLH
jgi:glutathione synthase